MSGGRRFEVSGTQIVAGVLATVTGAIAASYLGVAGTVIGAAVMSVASTGGGAIYKYFLGRTAERVREAAPVITQRTVERATAVGARSAARLGVPSDRPAGAAVPSARDAAGGHGVGPPRAAGEAASDRADPGRQGADPGRRGADPGRHEAGPGLQGADAGRQGADAGRRGADAGRHEAGPGDRGQHPAGPAGDRGDYAKDPGIRAGDPQNGPAAGERGPGARRRVRPGWLAAAIGTAGIFLGVIAAITVFELATGKPLDAVVWHRSGSGTTVGGLVGGQGQARPRHTSPASPTVTPSSRAGSPAPGSTHTTPASPSPSPTATSGSPSPSPSRSPSPSSSASRHDTPTPAHTP